ncbi:hypothetical protein O1611_g4735 [Lasiodiplodia mahajangana]|uniref:Uncharacterized protein n=1 Tax=Lasiodiplodia mahajangana TaxID=1108764 RepID=A0ACC2JN37_9PEZI|nr:hypothetical protein O1611_g4735 [Lasiodiplodia mahajangana]
MTILPDPYKILGVSKDAQITEIRAAHRKLVLKCHPDKIQDPAQKAEKQIEFQQVQQAYELLSNETERDKYDQKAEIYELIRERERAKAAAAATARATPSTPREPPLYYHVKEASPRSTTFGKSSPYGRTPPRSWEDTTARAFGEETRRHARKTASYEREKPSKRDEERRSKRKEEEEKAREREAREAREMKEAKEARKAKERKEEKERIARELERERRKEEKKAQSDREKERGKERKAATAEKHRSKQTVIEEDSDSSPSSDYEEDVVFEPKPKTERKKSSSGRKPEDIDHTPTSDRTRKLSGAMEGALEYLARSGTTLSTSYRSKTFAERSMSFNTPMVPTPPPATAGPFTPPAPPPPPQVEEPEEMSEEEMIRRSRAQPTPRRMSHDTPRSSRDKAPGHKKSSSSRDHQPIIVEAGSPPTRTMPSLSRAHTDSYARAMPIPLHRSETWNAPTERERERHERSRSRPSPLYADDEGSDDGRDRRHRRSRRNLSPEPVSQVRYTVDSGKSIPIRPKQYHDQAPRGSYSSSKKGASAYVVPNSSARLHRANTSYTRDYYEQRPQHFSVSGVKYSQQFNERDIAYSDLPYGGASYPSDVYAS